MMMNERPNCVCENMRMELGNPASATSSGSVTCFSTSSAARPGNSVMTVTCVSVTSGKASTGNCLKAMMPAPINSTVPSITNSGCLSANSTIFCIMAGCELRRNAPLFHDAPRLQHLLQQQRAIGHDFLPGLHAGCDRDIAFVHIACFDFLTRVPAAAVVDENEVAA